MDFNAISVQEFLRRTGSSDPTPGGGSIAALTGATGAALVQMVANLTLHKKGYEDVQSDMEAVCILAQTMESEFLKLIDADCAAFEALMGAYRMPKDTDEEKELRQAAIQETTKKAALAPFKIGELAYALFEIAEIVVHKGNKNAITDGIMGGIQGHAAMKSAFLNVRINLGSLKDKNFVRELEEKMARMEQSAAEREANLLKAL